MGFLDDLKKDQTLAGGTEDLDPAGALYIASVQDKMRALKSYLDEFALHLNNSLPEQSISYEIEGYGTLGALKAKNFAVSVDNPEMIRACTLRYCCFRPLGVEFYQRNKELGERQQQYLWKHKLRFSSRKLPDERWLFELESYVPIAFEFVVNPAKRIIQLRVTNQESLGTVGYSYDPEDINPLYLDEMAKYIMRRQSRFHELSGDVVPDDTLAKLRQQVAERKAEREKELGSIPKPKTKAKSTGKGLFKGLFKR